MRVAAPLLLFALLVAGCASPAHDPSAPTAGADAPAASDTTAAAVSAPLNDTVVLLSYAGAYQPDADLPPANWTTPPGTDHLTGSATIQGSPCGAAGSPDLSSLGQPMMVFTSPSGATTSYGPGAVACSGTPVAVSAKASFRLGGEAGPWKVTFTGRGTHLTLLLTIVAEPATPS